MDSMLVKLFFAVHQSLDWIAFFGTDSFPLHNPLNKLMILKIMVAGKNTKLFDFRLLRIIKVVLNVLVLLNM